LERACSISESKEHFDVAASLCNEVESSDATVNDTVLDIFRNVVSADKKKIDVSIATVCLEHALSWFLGRDTTRLK
jgi:hypothetical protein